PAPDPDMLDLAVGTIASARRPVVVAGRGASTPDAREALLRLAGRLGAPVATTLKAKDLFRGERFDLGFFGSLAHAVALDTIQASDCVIVFGGSLNKWTTAEGSLLAGKRVVQVDVDRDALGRSARVDVAILGDAAATADAMVELLDEASTEPTGFASHALAERLAAVREEYTDHSTSATVDIRTALDRIDARFPADRNLVFDAGRWVFKGFTMLHVPEPSAYVHSLNFGAIGLGMGTAIGAAFGAPERPTLMVTGDGGFMLGGLAEFNTAVRHGLDIVVVVFNDRCYGSELMFFREKGIDPAIASFDWPDLAAVATALGGEGRSVRNLDELDSALDAIDRRTGPMLLDIAIDPENVPL
ncbi:thiamine pyrophosphate-dependent enzyme, partial [Microbacterium sp. X-17]|uniref:thiamine pyrophosphate-binding protein n=1 Tax=Microbacterium sp. X-17 TaxID=3144404 RepID=UPI0031F5B086